MDFEQSDKVEVIPYEDKPITEVTYVKEPIRVYEEDDNPKWKEYLARSWGIVALTVAFATIFLIAYIFFNPSALNDSNQGEGFLTEEEDLPVVGAEETSTSVVTDVNETPNPSAPPLVLDESMLGIDINMETDTTYSLAPLIDNSDGVKVIIIHSHTSEYVSETVSVLSAGEVLSQILNSGGISTLHCKTVHDADGTIGSYERMKDTLASLQSEHQGAVIVIDLHDSDTGRPFTLTVGTGFESGWRENVKLACAITSNVTDVETVIRLLPGILGQDSGILTLNVGVCGKAFSDEVGRKAISSLARAILAICEKRHLTKEQVPFNIKLA